MLVIALFFCHIIIRSVSASNTGDHCTVYSVLFEFLLLRDGCVMALSTPTTSPTTEFVASGRDFKLPDCLFAQ